MALNITVVGTYEATRYLQRVFNRIKNISNQEFAEQMKIEAQKNLNNTHQGWPNPESTPIRFFTRTSKLAKGSQVLMWATASGKDGYNFAAVQETGFDGERTAKDGKIMRFRTPQGNWVSKAIVGPIPAKEYMQRTAEWAAEAYPQFIELKIEDAIRR